MPSSASSQRSFNPLHRGIGLLTSAKRSTTAIAGRFQSSSSRHRSSDQPPCPRLPPPYVVFQSSSSRHRSSDKEPLAFPCPPRLGFNPLHRGIGLLTQSSKLCRMTRFLFQSSSSRHRSSDSAKISSALRACARLTSRLLSCVPTPRTQPI